MLLQGNIGHNDLYLVQFSLHEHKGGLKPHSFHFTQANFDVLEGLESDINQHLINKKYIFW